MLNAHIHIVVVCQALGRREQSEKSGFTVVCHAGPINWRKTFIYRRLSNKYSALSNQQWPGIFWRILPQQEKKIAVGKAGGVGIPLSALVFFLRVKQTSNRSNKFPSFRVVVLMSLTQHQTRLGLRIFTQMLFFFPFSEQRLMPYLFKIGRHEWRRIQNQESGSDSFYHICCSVVDWRFYQKRLSGYTVR